MTTQETKRLSATATIVNDFMFKCFEAGMTIEEAQSEAVKHESELQSIINGLVNEL